MMWLINLVWCNKSRDLCRKRSCLRNVRGAKPLASPVRWRPWHVRNRLNNNIEFINNDFKELFKRSEIIIKSIVTYTLEQNGLSEV